MLTRKRHRELMQTLQQQRRTQLQDIEMLHRQFQKQRRRPPRRREKKAKKKLSRLNQKIKDFHVEKFLELRDRHQMSYRQIGLKMTVKSGTVYAALKRYAARGEHCDMR